MSIGSQVELRRSERTEDQFGMKAYGRVKTKIRKKKKNTGKHVKVEALGYMYVKNQFEIYVLNSKRCSSSH